MATGKQINIRIPERAYEKIVAESVRLGGASPAALIRAYILRGTKNFTDFRVDDPFGWNLHRAHKDHSASLSREALNRLSADVREQERAEISDGVDWPQ